MRTTFFNREAIGRRWQALRRNARGLIGALLGAWGLLAGTQASAALPPRVDQASPRVVLEARVSAVREALQRSTGSAERPEGWRQLAQWMNWNNWPNWRNWGNWGNWFNQ